MKIPLATKRLCNWLWFWQHSASFPDVGEMLSKEHADQKDNRQCLLKVSSNIRFLARQGIALSGDADETDSNFIQLRKLRGLDDLRIEPWLQHKTDKYVSHDVKNELLNVMAISVLRARDSYQYK